MLVNAGSLVGTTAVTSILGFAYWWLAARRFLPEQVGIASASISAMMLLGSLCMLGFGTLLITELPRQPGHEDSLISTALIVVGIVGGCIGVAFATVAPYISANFQPLKANIADVGIFAAGVSLTAITLVLDQALIGILCGGLQLWRNSLFAMAKLVVLFLASLWLLQQAGITIYGTWAMGQLISLVALGAFVVVKKGWPGKSYLPQWSLLRKLGSSALQHHVLNLTLQAPTLLLPVLVTVFLSATMNAWFYVSWMIASFVFVVPTALTTVLHAMNSARPSTLGKKARVTICLALVTSIIANCLLQFDTKQVLSLFGSSYAAQAAWSLRILGLAAFPLVIKNHYISICRIQDRIVWAMIGMLPGGILELCAAIMGAHLGGLSGLSLGWVAAITVESIAMFGTVYKTVRNIDVAAQKITSLSHVEMEPIWLADTSIMIAVRSGNIDTSFHRTVRQSYNETMTNTETEINHISPDLANRGRNGKLPRLRPTRLQRYIT